jgi:hypothetical protein
MRLLDQLHVLRVLLDPILQQEHLHVLNVLQVLMLLPLVLLLVHFVQQDRIPPWALHHVSLALQENMLHLKDLRLVLFAPQEPLLLLGPQLAIL